MEMMPLPTELPITTEMKASERISSAVFSGRSRNFSTMIARKGAQSTSTISETVSPLAEAMWATRSALLASPRCAMGKPSSVVMYASGVPGVLKRIAGTAPPTVAPFIMPMRKPSTGSRASSEKPKMEMSIGSAIAIAMGPARPGVAPTVMPSRKPPRIIKMVMGTPSTGSDCSTASTPALR